MKFVSGLLFYYGGRAVTVEQHVFAGAPIGALDTLNRLNRAKAKFAKALE